jgi:hypothetical protein
MLNVPMSVEMGYSISTNGKGQLKFTFLSFIISFVLIHILEVLSSNVGPDTGFPDVFVVFLSFSRKFRDTTSNYATTASFHILSNSSIYHPFIRRYIV